MKILYPAMTKYRSKNDTSPWDWTVGLFILNIKQKVMQYIQADIFQWFAGEVYIKTDNGVFDYLYDGWWSRFVL